VPFVNSNGVVEYGRLICELIDAGGITGRPDPHTAHFTGVPFDNAGNQLANVINQVVNVEVVKGFWAATYLSQKPAIGYYLDYHAKVTQYVKIISGWASLVDPSATARTHRVMALEADDSVFEYLDSASSRSGITELAARLTQPVAIIGLGGTGSYVLDLVAKTHATEIHLWDGDHFQAHNAFRSPAAASIAELNERPMKVDHHKARYVAMRRGIIGHPEFVDDTNVSQLAAMSFVFICMDTGPAKRVIVDKLEEFGVPFIDTGMGVKKQHDALGGIVRLTTSLPDHREHTHRRISFANEQDDEYDRNIQVAELNALNATLAVIKWKKIRGFYVDLEKELHATYPISGNIILNSDQIE